MKSFLKVIFILCIWVIKTDEKTENSTHISDLINYLMINPRKLSGFIDNLIFGCTSLFIGMAMHKTLRLLTNK